jgi:predicted transcriptional regulator
MSKTKQALELVDSGMTAYAAAKQIGIAQSVISRALVKREQTKDRRCPCCNQVVLDDVLLKKLQNR